MSDTTGNDLAELVSAQDYLTNRAGHAEDALRQAAEGHAEAVIREMQMDDDKPIRKHEAIVRIMATPNALTGKPHSYSSAEVLAETDPEYAEFLDLRRVAVLAKFRRKAEHDIALSRLRAL